MQIKETIEKFDPGHFDRRHDYLIKLSKQVRSMGFFPLQITQNDIDCYWIRLEGNDNKVLNVSFDLMDVPGFVDILKEVARYEK